VQRKVLAEDRTFIVALCVVPVNDPGEATDFANSVYEPPIPHRSLGSGCPRTSCQIPTQGPDLETRPNSAKPRDLKLTATRKTPNTQSWRSVRQFAVLLLKLLSFDHDDRVPRAAVKKRSCGALAGAFTAANALQGIHLNHAERRSTWVLHEDHAFVDGTVRRPCSFP